MSKRVSTISIAKECGVSQPTVSRILRDQSHLYKPETVRLVQETSARLGYRPSHMARSLRTGSTHCIAMLTDTDARRSELQPQFLVSLSRIAEASDYHLIVSAFEDVEVESDSFMPLILKHLMADGLLLNYHTAPPKHMVRLIERHRISSVWINNQRDHNAVFPDEFAAGRGLTEHLIGLGHRRIAYVDRMHHAISTAEPHYSRVDRYRGYRVAMQAAGLSPEMIAALQSTEDFDLWLATLRQRLLGKNGPTAIVSSGYDNDLAYIIRGALGLRFPEDISYATISVPDEWSGFACAKNDWKEIAQQAFQMLLAIISTKEKSHPAISIPPIIDVGESTGTPS